MSDPYINWEKDHYQSKRIKTLKDIEREVEQDRQDMLNGVQKPEPKKTELICSWHKCGQSIGSHGEDCYFKCARHREVFCKSCATRQGEFTKYDFPVCKRQKVDRHDCIWNKIYIEEDQAKA